MHRAHRAVGLLGVVVCLGTVVASRPLTARNGEAKQLHAASHLGSTIAAQARHPMAASQKIIPPIPTEHLETGPFIDGAKTPEQIPSDVAYSLFVQMLRNTDTSTFGQRHHNSYVRHVLRQAGREPTLADTAALTAFAMSYGYRLHTPRGVVTTPAEKAALVAEIRASMPKYLGADLAKSIAAYVEGRFKLSTKIIL